MNYELKLKARAALKGNWQVALMVALIASLPSLISQVVSILTGSSYSDMMNGLLAAMQENPYADTAELLQSANITLQSYGPSTLVSVAAALLSPFLTLGMINYSLMILRGDKEAPITTVFSRTGCFFKGLGLNLMIFLRVFLWMLPGGLVMTGAIFIPQAGVSLVMMYAGMAAMLVLGIRAAMHYAMAMRFMADDPGKGVNQSIRESVSMMSQRKLLLFSLEISFIGWNFLLMLVQMLVTSMFGNVLGSTCYMVLNLALNVYMQTASCAFYEAYRDQPVETEPVNTGDIGNI